MESTASFRVRSRGWGVLLLVGALLPAACTLTPPPVLSPPLQPGDEVVVLVPGLTGSQLRDPVTGRVVWGDGRSVFLPRDRGRALALPLVEDAGHSGELEAFDVVREVRLLGVIRKAAYAPIVRLMGANGYRAGNLLRAQPGESFFVFPYDWRRDSVEIAGELAGRLEELRRLRGEDVLRVALVCQSTGAHLCRWLAKYGAGSLEAAEAGEAAPPAGLEVTRLILVGTSNGGSLRSLRFLARGRIYVGGIGRRWAPETLFTWPSLYQDLPAYRRHLFLDGEGRPRAVDLFDPAAWRRYGWGIYAPEVAALARSGELPAWLGGPPEWEAFLARALDRARRFHRLLAADAPAFGATRYHLLQSPYAQTPDRAVLVREDGAWRTWFTGDPDLELRPYLEARASAPGDGHATLASQRHLSPQEQVAVVETFYVEGGHFELILHPAAQRRLLEFLAE